MRHVFALVTLVTLLLVSPSPCAAAPALKAVAEKLAACFAEDPSPVQHLLGGKMAEDWQGLVRLLRKYYDAHGSVSKVELSKQPAKGRGVFLFHFHFRGSKAMRVSLRLAADTDLIDGLWFHGVQVFDQNFESIVADLARVAGRTSLCAMKLGLKPVVLAGHRAVSDP